MIGRLATHMSSACARLASAWKRRADRFEVISLCLLAMLTVSCAEVFSGGASDIKRWEWQMVRYGTKWCDYLKDPTTPGEHKLAGTYYDANRVYQQIAGYTKDPKWLECASTAQRIYRDDYLFRHNGKLPGYWIFPHGLLADFERTGDVRSKEAVLLLARNAAYANVGHYDASSNLLTSKGSREAAYNLEAKMLAEQLGESYRDHVKFFVDAALGHLDQCCISRTATFIQPFMVGITAEALIMYHDRTADPRIVPRIQAAMDYLWDRLWNSGSDAFLYIDRPIESEGGQDAVKPAPDLNLLIAPAFAWLYMQTGDPKYRDRGDQIFAGGVQQAAVDFGAKQFNQNYRWSFDYVKWRRQAESRQPGDAPKKSGG